MTFSIAGRCVKTGEIGVAITSSSIAVGSRCAWVRAGVGAVATQNVTDPSLGNAALDLLQSGLCPEPTLNLITEDRPHIEHRQLLIVDRNGRTGHFSGSEILGCHAISEGRDAVAGGNMLASRLVPNAMIVAFELNNEASLADRLIGALDAGLECGGEEGDIHSAVLLIAKDHAWPYVDLRVDWHKTAPLDVLRGLWEAYEPQAEDYAVRAVDPDMAPSYGVPGDL